MLIRPRVGCDQPSFVPHDRRSKRLDGIGKRPRPLSEAWYHGGTVKRHDVRLRMKREKHRREIAVSDDRLRLPPKPLVVKMRQDRRGVPSADTRNHAVDGPIPDECIDLVRPLSWRSGSMGLLPLGKRSGDHLEPQRSKRTTTVLPTFGVSHRARRRRRHDSQTCAWLDDGRHSCGILHGRPFDRARTNSSGSSGNIRLRCTAST